MSTIQAVVRERHGDPLLDLTRWIRATGAALPAASIGASTLPRHAALPTDASSAARLVDGLVDEGVRLLLIDVPETPVIDRAVIALLTSRDAARVAPEYRPGNEHVDQWRDQVAAITRLTWESRHLLEDVASLGSAMGAANVDVLAQILLGAARRSTPVVLAGVAGCAAALVAQRIEHRSAGWLAMATRPSDPAAIAAQERLALSWVVSARVSEELESSDLAVAHAHLSAVMAL